MNLLMREVDQEQHIRPEDTAHFPFTVTAKDGLPSAEDFLVTSVNPHFCPDWAFIVAPRELRKPTGEYSLHVHPHRESSHVYGKYELQLSVAATQMDPGLDLRPGLEAKLGCLLVVKPCVHTKGRPRLRRGSGGELKLSMSLVNCSDSELSVSITLNHRRSGGSQSWTVDLEVGVGPFDLGELVVTEIQGKIHRFDKFDLEISAEDVDVVKVELSPNPVWPTTPQRVFSSLGVAAAVALLAFGLAAAARPDHHPPVPPTTITTTIITTTTVVAGPGISVPEKVDCGTARIGSAASCSIHVGSDGSQALEVTRLGPSPPGFEIQMGSCAELVAPGGSCNLQVVFSPSAVGTIDGSITIHQNLPGPPSMVELVGIGLSGGTNSPPTIVGLSPNYGSTAGGTLVTISGANFTVGANTTFDFGPGNTATSVDCTTSTICTVMAPPAASPGAVNVIASANDLSSVVNSSSDQFTYEVTRTVNSVTPPRGPLAGGTTVTITGTNFTGASAVDFGSTSVPYTVTSSTEITATSPAVSKPQSVNVTVTVSGVTSTPGQFTYYEP